MTRANPFCRNANAHHKSIKCDYLKDYCWKFINAFYRRRTVLHRGKIRKSRPLRTYPLYSHRDCQVNFPRPLGCPDLEFQAASADAACHAAAAVARKVRRVFREIRWRCIRFQFRGSARPGFGNLTKPPAPIPNAPHPAHPPSSDFGSEHRTEPIPPQPHRLMANIDAALEKQVFNVSQAQRKPDVQHHRHPDHLRRRIEVPERIGFQLRTAAHRATLSSPSQSVQFALARSSRRLHQHASANA